MSVTKDGDTGRWMSQIRAVSYTHLDVYKRQDMEQSFSFLQGSQ